MVSAEVEMDTKLEMDTKHWDVAVIGGGAAGLSAATALGRSRRTVIVLDDGKPRNAPAAGVHNFLSREGTPPAELLAAGRGEVEAYGGLIVGAEATAARRDGDGFAVTTGDGAEVRARRLVVTTGLVDELPDVPGVRELWGSDVVHCPYCHGWEHADEAIGVLASGPMAVHQALLFRQLTEDLVLFLHTAPPLTAEESEQLEALGVRVVAGPVERLETAGGRLSGVRMGDGAFVPRTAVAVGPRMVARSGVLAGLGLEAVPHAFGAAFGEFIESDPTGQTAVPGVWVAGNVTDIQAHVIAAAAQGVMAGAAVNADLVAEDARRAVDAVRAGRAGRAARARVGAGADRRRA
jgi:thioredoxin reductase